MVIIEKKEKTIENTFERIFAFTCHQINSSTTMFCHIVEGDDYVIVFSEDEILPRLLEIHQETVEEFCEDSGFILEEAFHEYKDYAIDIRY